MSEEEGWVMRYKRDRSGLDSTSSRAYGALQEAFRRFQREVPPHPKFSQPTVGNLIVLRAPLDDLTAILIQCLAEDIVSVRPHDETILEIIEQLL